MKTIGQRIKAYRAKRRMSQSVFAAWLGVPTSTLQEWEQGRHKPRGYAAVALERRMKGMK